MIGHVLTVSQSLASHAVVAIQFQCRPFRVGFVMEKMVLGQVTVREHGFFPDRQTLV